VSEAGDAKASQQAFADAQAEVGVRCPDLLDPEKFGHAIQFATTVLSAAAQNKAHPVNAQLQRLATPKERAAHLLETFANASGYVVKPRDSVVQSRNERSLREHARSTVSGRARPSPSTQFERDRNAFDDSMAKHGM
jgi:hypothetical protein